MKELIFKVRIEERAGYVIPTPRMFLLMIQQRVIRGILDNARFRNNLQIENANKEIQAMVNVSMEVGDVK